MKNIIQQLKDNEKPFGLMSEEMQEKAKAIEPPGNFLFFTPYRPNGGIEWALMAGEQNELHNHFTYRLRPDYEEEPEIAECEVELFKNELMYLSLSGAWTKISHAPNKPDFIGFKFEDGVMSGYSVRYRHPSGTFVNITIANLSEYEVLHATHVLFRRNKP